MMALNNKYYLLLISIVFAVGCINNKKTEKLSLCVGDGNDVKVTLNIEENPEDIVKIEFLSNNNIVLVDKKEIEKKDVIIYSFNNKGEGVFKVCVYKLNDTICSENYIEKGYEPKLKLEKDSLIVIDFL